MSDTSDLPEEGVPEQLRLQINAFDLEELRDLVGDKGRVDEAKEKPVGAQGEPITMAVIIVTPIVVQALAAWLLKKRRKKLVEVRAEKIGPDGTREVLVVKVDVSESSTEADVVQQVVDGFKLDPSLIERVAALGG